MREYDAGFFRDCTLYPSQEATIFKDVRELTEQDLAGAETLVHLAGISNDPFGSLSAEAVYDPTRAYTARLATLCRAMGIRFIFASSCSVYGIGGEALVTEESPTFPQTPYSLNKLQIEQDLTAMSDGTFAPIILRFATVFGLSPRMRFDLVVNMCVGMALTNQKIILNSDGKAWRPLVHIEDACEAIRRCLNMPLPPRGPLRLNIGDTGQSHRILEVAEMIQRQVPGCELEFLPQGRQRSDDGLELVRDRKIQDGVDRRTYRVACERVKEALPGFACAWPVARGIERLIGELRALGLTQTQLQDIRFYRVQYLESLLKAGSPVATLT